MKPFALSGPGEIADPYPVYARYRELDPVHAVAPSTPHAPGTWYVFRFDDVTRVLGSDRFGRGGHATPIPPDFPALRRMVAGWLVFLDPPWHTRLRALITRHFTARVVASLRPRIAQIAEGLAAGIRLAPRTDLVADFAAPLPILVISELLGIAPARRDWLRTRAVALQQANTSRGDGGREARLRSAEAAAAELSAYLLGEVARRRRGGTDDLTSALVHAQPGLTDAEIVATCVHLLTAGHETTTNLLAKGTLALLRHPQVRDRLVAHPTLMPAAVDELIRYDGPVQLVTRWAHRPATVGGVDIPAGSKVIVVLGSANRDPRRFPDADTLDISRDAARHAGFGAGIHYCLGAGLAKAEAEIGFTALLRCLPGLARTDEPVEYADDLVFHGPSRVPLSTGTVAGRR
jgi:cytochrome P450